MPIRLSLEAQQLIRSISDSDLVEVSFDQSIMSLKLVFSFEGFSGGVGHEIIMAINRLITLTLIPPVHDTLPFLVTNVTVIMLEQEAGQHIFRIHVEGAVEIKADAGHIQLYKEIGTVVE